MRRRLTNRMAVGAVGVAVLAAAGGTYAASRPSAEAERDAFLKSAAERLDGVSSSELEDALKGAASDRLDAAVKAGRLTKEQADEIKRRNERNGLPFLGGPGHHHRGGPGGPRGAVHDAAAKYLGVSEATLRRRVMAGRSLADIAKSRGKSVDGLKEAIEKSIRSELDEAVKDKRLTDAQRDEMLEDVDERVTRIVNRDGPKFRRGGFGPRGGPGDGPPGPPGGFGG